MYLYNATFTIHPVANDFDVLARVVQIVEHSTEGKQCSQLFALLDASSLRNLRDVIGMYLRNETEI